MRAAALRPHREHRVDCRQGRQSERVGLQRGEGRGHRADEIARQGAGGGGHRRQLHHAGGGEDAHLRADDAGAHRLHAVEDSARAVRPGGGNRRAGRLARVRGEFVRDRRPSTT